MDALFGMPEWLFATLFGAGFIAIICVMAWRNTKRLVARLIDRRPSPSKDEFLALMAPDVSHEASEFIWERSAILLAFGKDELAPHPDDHLVEDLPIDDEEWSMYWPQEWAELKDFHESNLYDWPGDWPVTIRNYGRWLDMGPQV